ERHGIEHFTVTTGDLFPDSGPQLQGGKEDRAGQTGQRDADQYPPQPPGAQQQLLDWRNVFHARDRRSNLSEVATRRALICCGAREIATSALRRACQEGRISTFEKLGAEQKAPNSQAPSSKEAPSSKLENRTARRLTRPLILRFGV